MLASIPADVSKRLVIISCAAALFAAACSNPPEAKVSYGSGVTFVPFVADNLDNAGMGNAVALDSEGIPYLSYWIFPGDLAKGAIPIPRPIGAPFISTTPTPTTPSKQGAAVGVASLSADGIWTRGAAAQVQDTPKGIYIPYGPATVDSLVGATAKNTNGTDIALDANGGKHVVWTGPDGVWYAEGTDAFTATQVYPWPPLDQAGPVGRPSIAVDADGVPWVAFAIDTAKGQEVRVATLGSKNAWTTEVAASSPLCSGCAQPGPAQIGVTPTGPIVVYVDGSSGELKAARQSGSAWTVETIHAGVAASAPSLTIDTDGGVHVAYYTADAVYVASSLDPGWVNAKVADAQPTGGTGNQAQTTGIATDDAGATYVTWADATGGVTLVKSDDGQTFTPVETPGTSGGAFPSLGVTPDGSHVYLAWYAVASQDLLLGVESDVDGLLIAQPSPTPTAIPSQGGTCAPTGSTDLTIVASGTLFDLNCLAVTPGTKFTVTLDNQDPIPHDFSIYPSSTDLQNPLFSSLADPNPGQTSVTYDIDALDAGTYFFQCDFHPTSMTGTFIVAKT
jgi:plastocyanin